MSTADHEALLNTVAGALVVEELVRSGVDQFVVAPGSRSTPIVEAIVRHPRARMTVIIDERSAAFYALGFGRKARRPARRPAAQDARAQARFLRSQRTSGMSAQGCLIRFFTPGPRLNFVMNQRAAKPSRQVIFFPSS